MKLLQFYFLEDLDIPSENTYAGFGSENTLVTHVCILQANVICKPGDKIKVFWLAGQIYEAKIIKQEAPPPGQKWPHFYVHYLVRSLKAATTDKCHLLWIHDILIRTWIL